jgi:hypothetical protein
VFQNQLWSVVQFGVPESHDVETLRRQPGIPLRVVRFGAVFLVLRSIEFHDKLVRETDKVDDVDANCRLSAKLVSAKLLRTEDSPQRPFGSRWSIPHFASELALLSVAVHCGRIPPPP